MKAFSPRLRHLDLALRTRGAFVCALGTALLFNPLAGRAEQVVLASGPRDGFYDHLAHGIGRRLENPRHPPVRIYRTFDPSESLRWIADEEDAVDGEVRFAFVRQDLMGDHFRSLPDTPVRIVGKVGL